MRILLFMLYAKLKQKHKHTIYHMPFIHSFMNLSAAWNRSKKKRKEMCSSSITSLKRKTLLLLFFIFYRVTIMIIIIFSISSDLCVCVCEKGWRRLCVCVCEKWNNRQVEIRNTQNKHKVWASWIHSFNHHL